jgi:phage FluMu gp28-like protein
MNSEITTPLLTYKSRFEKRPRPSKKLASPTSDHGLINFRPYQREAFLDRCNGAECWLWGRQTGKSFTLAAWAVDRLITRPGRLLTILSNSRANGMELNLKCAELCELRRYMFEQADLSSDFQFQSMNYETRIHSGGKVGRIKVLPASPRTARGFSGDLILDEFAFHEDSAAIWEAAEPILAANPDYLCRIASTPNGRQNMFYRLVTAGNIPVRRVTRTDAWNQGMQIFHPITREPITPEQARELATDKRSYDQNYECAFEIENMTLLTHELISSAERAEVGVICEENWSPEVVQMFSRLMVENEDRTPQFFCGVDVGRFQDLTVITVVQKQGPTLLVRAILRMRALRLPQQQERLAAICGIRGINRVMIDMTGLGLGLCEYAQMQYGGKIKGLHFGSSIALASRAGGSREKIRVPEALATQLLQVFEDRRIQHPIDDQLREDLRKPERIVSSSGKVSIAACRDENGHADHFWSLALAVHAAIGHREDYIQVIKSDKLMFIPRDYLL